MKRTSLLFAALLFSAYSFAVTIHRVNNLAGAATGVNCHTTINAAVAAAADDDIIYIEPSTIPYSESAVITKRLHLIGNGNFLDQNPNTPYDKKNSTTIDVTFSPGSENGSAAGLNIAGNLYLSTSNILIKKCKVNGYIYSNGANDVIVTQCFFNLLGVYSGASPQNWSLTNNIITNGVSGLHNALISNNTFSNVGGDYITGGNGLTISNNVFFRKAGTDMPNLAAGNPSSSVNNNLFVLSASTSPLPANFNNNVHSNDPDNIFVVGNPSQKDAEFQLKSGSPAIGIGTGGVDAGAFGGVAPYTLSTLPNIPIVTSATSSGVGNSTTPLSVTISVRSN